MASLGSHKEKVASKAEEQMVAVIGGSDKVYVHGDINVGVPTQIMCNVEGNIKADAKVVVSTNGSIKGDITATELIVEEGKIIGNIVADKVLIASGAVVEGDVTTQSIAILEGASFIGAVRKPTHNGNLSKDNKQHASKPDGLKDH